MDARNIRSLSTQTVLLEIFPRLVAANNESPAINEMVEHAIILTSKLPSAFLCLGLVSIHCPSSLEQKSNRVLSLISQSIQLHLQRFV